MSSIPTNRFVRVRTDEGEIVKGFCWNIFYNDCHHSTYSGYSIVDFGLGVPQDIGVSDFDIRAKKDGLHFSNPGQVELLELGEGICTVNHAISELNKRRDRLKEGTPAYNLLTEYLVMVERLHPALVEGKLEAFANGLRTFGERKSNSFVGYEARKNVGGGLNGAPMNPESMDLISGTINTHVSAADFAQAYNALVDDISGRAEREFWPVELMPVGNADVRFFI